MFILSPFPRAFPCLSLNTCNPWLFCFIALVYIPIIQGYTTTTHPEPNVRLIDPARIDSHEGQIEVNVGGQWGPICGLDMGLYEADMFCRQLGYSLGAEEYYSDAGAEFGTSTYYSSVFYLGLSCDSGNENDINECSYNQLVAPTDRCSIWSYYGGVTCDKGSESNDDGYNLGWIIVILLIFLVYFIYRVKQKGLPSMPNCNNTCTDSTSTRNPEAITEEPSTTMPLNIVLNQEPPQPFTDDPANPLEDNPPQYDAVVPQGCPYPPQNGDASYPPQGAAGAPYPIGGAGTPYPPQSAGTPYPPPVVGPTYPSQGVGAPSPPEGASAPYPSHEAAPYPLQDSNSAFPPQNAGVPYPTQNPVFPPAGYIPNASNDAVPLTPPPSYDSLSTDPAS